MPPRSKRNVASRRHVATPPSSSPLLLSLEPEPQARSEYDALIPAVFDLEPPPSDPELGRASTLIRDPPHTPNLLFEPSDCTQEPYGVGTSESDIDDGGPVSPSTSPPDPTHRIQHASPPGPPPARSDRSTPPGFTVPGDTTSDESSLGRSVGHIRSPVLAREPTPLESFSRTIRNYVPSSIPIPSAAPSPPRVSRPVLFGSFLTPVTSPTTRERDSERRRRGSEASTQTDLHSERARGQRRSVSGAGDMPVFSLDDDIPEDGARDDDRRVTRYPGVGDTEEVLWAGWDILADASDASGQRPKPRSVLMLGYPSGIQLWDCSNLGSVSELLNLTGAQWGAVDFAAVLPDPAHTADDVLRPKRPLIGFLSRSARSADFIVYSLRTHEVVKRLSLIDLISFAASSQCIVLCTSNPPTLHIMSSSTLATLYTIPSSSLVPFTFPSTTPASSTKPNIKDVSTLDIDQHYLSARTGSLPRPIYALSNRLLAYVSPITRQESTTASTPPGQAHTSVPVAATDTTSLKFGLGVSQAELGNAAVKIGGSVLSGMKALGGLAMSAARAGVSAAVSGDQGHTRGRSTSGTSSAPGPGGGTLGMFFSKSAPAATGSPHEYQTAADRRRRSLRLSSPVDVRDAPAAFDSQATVTQGLGPPAPVSPVQAASGCNIIVVDLRPLLAPASPSSASGAAQREPELVAQFTFSRPQALSGIKFSADGTAIAVCSKDGHAVRILQLRPTPRGARRCAAGSASSAREVKGGSGKKRAVAHAPGLQRTPSSPERTEHLAESMRHVYTLRRGRTSAVVEAMEWAHDKVWFGMSTRKRTVHVFAVNPLGGRSEGGSHLAGKVVNSPELVSSPTELSPLVRVRLKPPPQDSPNIPCAFTFLRSSESTLPPSLLPPAAIHFSPSASSSPSSITSAGPLKPVSPAQRPTRPTNYKDMLVFDPNDGTLALRRIFVERAAVDQAVIPESIPVAGGMSISLPGMSTLSRMGQAASPPGAGASPHATPASGLTQMMEKSMEIVGRESVVGTWSLARGRDWPEVKQSLRLAERSEGRAGGSSKPDWLSRAELSTFSSSHRILPRLIYLSHQFSFHALGEDYHALIRSYHLDVPSTKIEVRTPIEVSAFATGDSDAFVQGMASHQAIGRTASSFDEPLASALSAQLHPLHPSPPVLPMLPNGTPGSASGSKSLIAAIPIRQVAAGIQDGMSEGLGRIRRELGKARSPRLQPTRPGQEAAVGAPHGSSVPLEFDEEDEDFLVKDVVPTPLSSADRVTEADMVSRAGSAGAGVSGTGFIRAGEVVQSPSPLMSAVPLLAEEDGELMWEGWGPEEQQAVEEAERFDDITVGFLDEEHETMRETMRETEVKKSMVVGMGTGRKRRGRKG